MLCRRPKQVKKTLQDMPDGEKADMGLTTTPEGAEPPQLHLTVYTEGPNAWKVRCRLTPAVEGTNESVYLAAGSYAIGRAWYPEYDLAGPIDDLHSQEIHGILSEANSDWSRRAEQEHCDDWLRAHEITLKAAENTIRYASPGLENRRFASRYDAYQGALEAFRAHSPHNRIAEVFEGSLIATPRQHDFFPMEFRRLLLKLFLEVGDLTGERDSRRWHHFAVGGAVRTSDLGWGDWFSSRGRHYRRIVQSPEFSVGVTTTQNLIHL